MPAGVGLPRLSVGQLAIQGSLRLQSGSSACAIFITCEHMSTNLTRVTSVCALIYSEYVMTRGIVHLFKINSCMRLLTSLYGTVVDL